MKEKLNDKLLWEFVGLNFNNIVPDTHIMGSHVLSLQYLSSDKYNDELIKYISEKIYITLQKELEKSDKCYSKYMRNSTLFYKIEFIDNIHLKIYYKIVG